MKPRITIDSEGVVLHVDTDNGNQMSIQLEPQTVVELVSAIEIARARLKTPEGKSTVLRGLGRLLLELTEPKQVKGR